MERSARLESITSQRRFRFSFGLVPASGLRTCQNMLTHDQEQWVNSLSDRIVSVVPYDPRTERLFMVVKKKILDILGPEAIVEHCGASSLGISGQDEIDVSVVASSGEFADYAMKLDGKLGSIASWYPDRVRFDVREEGKKIDLKVVDGEHPNHLRGKIFERHLRTHPEDLERYRALKEGSNSLTTKEYYRRKIEFINEILEKAE